VRNRSVVLALAILSLPSAAWAGAWTLPEGTGQWLATVDASTAANSFNGNAAPTSTPRYNKVEAQLFIEYGLTDRLTAIVDPGLQHIDIAAPVSAARTGLGYTEFGGRYAFWQDQTWVLSGQATLRIPGTTNTPNPAAIGYTDVEADVRVLLGHAFTIGATPVFFDLQAAERIRTEGAPSEFRFDATLGVQVMPRWLVLVQSFNVVSEGAGSPIYGPSYDYEKLQLSAVYALTPAWSVQAGGFTAYAGRNALQENGLIFGVWRTF
jgi:protein XagA